MSNLGAIPKAKGGARPKTKAFSNGRLPNTNAEKLHLSLKSGANGQRPISKGDASLGHALNINNHKTKSSFDETGNPRLPPFQDTGSHSEPLEQRHIVTFDGGVQIKRAALSPEWVERRVFVHYTSPPLTSPEEDLVLGAVEAWTEQMEFLIEDLTWLLNLPHQRFWSQIVFDKSVQECLEAYLMSGPRWYDQLTRDENSLAVINDIHQLVFLIYVRMATYKESKENFITPCVFGELIYENFIYDVCKILDLCALYGTTNKALLEKMISNIFTYQPKYYGDLRELVQSLKMVLENLQKKLGIFDLMTPRFVHSETNLSIEDLRDVIHYIVDTFSSLQTFLNVFPKACETFREKEFDLRLGTFYENAMPKLNEHLLSSKGELAVNEVLLSQNLARQVDVARVTCLSIFRTILAASCLPDMTDQKSASSTTLSKDIETFTHILTSCIEEKIFLTDYNSIFDVNKDLSYFQERGADMTTLNFMKEAVESIASETRPRVEAKEDAPSDHKLPHKFDDTSGMNGYYAGETSSLTSVEIESLVSSLQDLLPHLGAGFLKECLKFYSFSTEEVLHALLEENLPPCLDALDRNLQEASETTDSSPKEAENPKHSIPQPAQQEEVLVNRQNIYDDDEFDVFSSQPKRINSAKVHKGKAKGTRYEKDPELNEKVKNIIHQYESSAGFSIYEDEEKYSPFRSADYEDEYDDTYDDDETGDIDSFGIDKAKRERFQTVRGRGALNAPGLRFEEEHEEEEEEDQQSEQKKEIGGNGKERVGIKDENGDNVSKGKFKRANASTKRGTQHWGEGSTLVFNNSQRTRPGPPATDPDPPASRYQDSESEAPQSHSRSSFVPFCENPADIRLRKERNRMNLQYKKKGYCTPSSDYQSSNDKPESSQHHARTSTASNKHSGKSWRQGAAQVADGDDDRRHHGGKYKEDTNHGKAQDRNFRHKMIHKNQQRRNAAQAKYRSNL